MRYKEIDIEWTPAELDRFLQENYGYSLWHFSWSFIRNSFLWKDYREGGEIKTLKKVKRDLEKNLNVLQKKPFPYESFIHLRKTIKAIDKPLNSQNTRGAPSKRLSIIALIWSYFIRDEHETHLANISGLLEWFNDKAEYSEFFVSFLEEIESLNNKKLKKLIARHRKENTHGETIEEGKDIFEMPAKAIAISFEDKRVETKRLEKSDWEKNTPLITFPNGEKLTIGDFEENSKKTKVLYKNKAYPIF